MESKKKKKNSAVKKKSIKKGNMHIFSVDYVNIVGRLRRKLWVLKFRVCFVCIVLQYEVLQKIYEDLSRYEPYSF